MKRAVGIVIKGLGALVAFLLLAIVVVKTFGTTVGPHAQRPQSSSVYTVPAGYEAEGVEMARHRGRGSEAGVEWDTQVVTRSWGGLNGRTLAFARPLAEDVELVRSEPAGLQLVRDEDGKVIGVRWPKDKSTSMQPTWTLRQPGLDRAELQAPLLGGRVIQQIMLEGVHFEPADETPVALFPGYIAQRDLDEDQIEWCEETLAEISEARGRPIYVRPQEGFFAQGGLLGEVIPDGEYRRGRLVIFGSSFAGVVLLTLAVFKVLGGRAREEEADAFLRSIE